MIHALSLGAGVQSSTLAMLAARGVVEPMPTVAIFADTGDEPTAVYRWLDWLAPRLPFPIERVSVGRRLSDEQCRLRVSCRSGRVYHRGLIPAYQSGGAPAFRHCTQEFKLRPIFRALRRLADGQAVVQWLGISADETQRMRPARPSWLRNRYPLVELGWTRRRCLEWWAAEGLPQPPRSACVFCPYRSDIEWDRLKHEAPDDFDRAVALERRLNAVRASIGQPPLYLHPSLRPLDTVVFPSDGGQGDLWRGECSGLCAT